MFPYQSFSYSIPPQSYPFTISPSYSNQYQNYHQNWFQPPTDHFVYHQPYSPLYETNIFTQQQQPHFVSGTPSEQFYSVAYNSLPNTTVSYTNTTTAANDEQQTAQPDVPVETQPVAPVETISSITLAANTPRRFFGKKEVSKQGKRGVLVYTIPGTRMVHSFSHMRTNKSHEVYRCIRCQAEGSYVKIRVVGDEFLEDPCTIGHVCLSRSVARETDTRKFYEDMQNVRQDENCASQRTKQIWYKGLRERNEADLPDQDHVLREELLAEYYSKGYDRRKRQIARNLAKHKDKRASMGFVPPDLETLSDGTLFLQEREESFHIYYSTQTIEQACGTGLYALVADGVHSPQPKELGRGAQLYCVHGVCGNGTEVPLIFAITAKKTRTIYRRIFGHLQDQLERFGARRDLRIVLDYEKSAINAAKSLFPEAKVEGCAFHMAQTWNRRRDKLGLAKHITGPTRDRRVARWWETLKGLVFLPKRLRSTVRALRCPPVPREHEAYRKCLSFLRYLRTTWLSGPYRNLWCKWQKKELRTTNLAEAFHSSLQKVLNCDHPPLGTLIRALRDLDLEAKCALHRLERMPGERRHLRKRDALRRQRIDQEMTSFSIRYHARGVQDHHVEKYCRRMARFVSNKTN